jgi:hypothetical protein
MHHLENLAPKIGRSFNGPIHRSHFEIHIPFDEIVITRMAFETMVLKKA